MQCVSFEQWILGSSPVVAEAGRFHTPRIHPRKMPATDPRYPRGVHYSYFKRRNMRQAKAPSVESQIRRKQLSLLGDILRRDEHHPDRLVCFESGTHFFPRTPPGTKRRRGRPGILWAETVPPLMREHFRMNIAATRNLA